MDEANIVTIDRVTEAACMTACIRWHESLKMLPRALFDLKLVSRNQLHECY